MSTRVITGLFGLAVLIMGPTLSAAQSNAWNPLAPGLELGEFKVSNSTPFGDSAITILRVDPAAWNIVALSVSAFSDSGTSMTAKEWCAREGLVAAINAGMYQTDFKTHVGYMKCGNHANSSKANSYQSIAAFDPLISGIPLFRLFDLNQVTLDSISRVYGCVIQNLRLIAKPSQNRWAQQEKRWSEAALGEDNEGRVLLIFCRSPYSMWEFNRMLLELPIGLVSAQHLEGGPEAQFFLEYDTVIRNLTGSYETGFNENDDYVHAWAIPNVIGISRRTSSR